MVHFHVLCSLTSIMLGIYALQNAALGIGQAATWNNASTAEDNVNVSALEQLQEVRTVEEFLSLLKTADGQAVNMSDLFVPSNGTSGKYQVAEGGGRLAEPDDCSPRLTTVRLNMSSADQKIVFFPRCTKIERCGGCCSSPNLECVPSYTERVTLKVIQAEVPLSDSTMLVYKGFSNIIVERHLRCMVQCSLNAAKCGPSKLFVSNQCMCKCPEQFRCSPPHVWDPDVCTCVCSVRRSCCPVGEDCGLVFDNETCQCAIPAGIMRVSANNNYQHIQLDDIVGLTDQNTSSENTSGGVNAPQPSPQQQHISENTQPHNVSDDSCSRTVCPHNMVKVHNAATNKCGCRFQNKMRRP